MSQLDLSAEIARRLQQYTTDVEESLEVAQKTIGQDGVKKLKSSSPKDTGSYAKGWRLKKAKKGYIIHNKTDYQLTHLLEKGHAKVGGGRVAARPHIKRVEEQVIDDYVAEVERLISR